MKVKLTGTQYAEKVVEYCEEILKPSGKYTRSEAKAIDKFLLLSSILFAICPKGSLSIAFSKEERVPKTGEAVIKNKLLGEAIMIGKNGESPSTRKSPAERLSKLMNNKDQHDKANIVPTELTELILFQLAQS